MNFFLPWEWISNFHQGCIIFSYGTLWCMRLDWYSAAIVFPGKFCQDSSDRNEANCIFQLLGWSTFSKRHRLAQLVISFSQSGARHSITSCPLIFVNQTNSNRRQVPTSPRASISTAHNMWHRLGKTQGTQHVLDISSNLNEQDPQPHLCLP